MNDNFNGVAILYGSKAVGYKAAIIIATVATFLGSSATFLAEGLMTSFSGKGLVPQDIVGADMFLIVTALDAGVTTFGLPVSTTHISLGAVFGIRFFVE